MRVEPVAGPRANESEPIAAVLEAAITVIALVDAKRVLPSKIGLVMIVGNAATTGVLRLRYGLSLLCVFLFRLGVLLLLLRAFLLLLCGFGGLRLFLFLGRLGFLFLLLFALLLCVYQSSSSEGQTQNCCADHSILFHRGCLRLISLPPLARFSRHTCYIVCAYACQFSAAHRLGQKCSPEFWGETTAWS